MLVTKYELQLLPMEATLSGAFKLIYNQATAILKGVGRKFSSFLESKNSKFTPNNSDYANFNIKQTKYLASKDHFFRAIP